MYAVTEYQVDYDTGGLNWWHVVNYFILWAFYTYL